MWLTPLCRLCQIYPLIDSRGCCAFALDKNWAGGNRQKRSTLNCVVSLFKRAIQGATGETVKGNGQESNGKVKRADTRRHFMTEKKLVKVNVIIIIITS